MVKKTDKLEKIAKLLPEGLDESVAKEIASLVGEKIQEEVEAVKNTLVTKVSSFIRGQVDKLKEQALKELEMENDTFRNARLFESMRAMMAVEVTPEDELTAVNVLAMESENNERKLEALTSELNRTLRENVQAKNVLKTLNAKVKKLQEQNVALATEVQSLHEGGSEKALEGTALVITEENFPKAKAEEVEQNPAEKKHPHNEFLTEDVIKLMKGRV